MSASAADISWNGATDAVWGTGGNWEGGVATDVAVYNASSTANLSTTLGADFSIQGLKITTPTGLITIGGANTLTLGAGGIGLNVALQDLQFNALVALAAEQSRHAMIDQTLTTSAVIHGREVNLSKIEIADLTFSGPGMFTSVASTGDGQANVTGSLRATKVEKLAFADFGMFGIGAAPRANRTVGELRVSDGSGVAGSANRGGKRTVEISTRGAGKAGAKEKTVTADVTAEDLRAALKLKDGTGPLLGLAGAEGLTLDDRDSGNTDVAGADVVTVSDANIVTESNQNSGRQYVTSRLVSLVSPPTTGAWTGATDANWLTGTNWSGGTAPGTGDTATFDAAAGVGGATISLGAGVTVNTITFVREGGSLGAGNLATTGTAFALDLIGNGAFAPTHTIANVNDGLFGNGSSWIGDSLNSFVGIGFGSAQTIASFAFGRDNLGAFSDRAVGLYTIQFTTDADPAVNFGTATWSTIGTINMDFGTGVSNPALRHQFNLVTPVSATGFRLITPGDGLASGAAIDELELFATAGTPQTPLDWLEINPAVGFTVTWDGNDGDHFIPATVPRNLATTATAITSSDLGAAINVPFHRYFNLNDGIYGNANSWIGDNPSPTADIIFTGGARHVSSVAWGRHNGALTPVAYTDRCEGTYTLQSLDPTDNTTWVTLGDFIYKPANGDFVPGGFFSRWLRHQYSVATAGGGIRSAGIRLIVPDGTAIDELEVYASTMTWTNGAATGKWNLDTDANFSGAADAKFLTEDNVLFGNTAAGNVTLEGELNPSSVTVDSSSDYTFTGAGSITGAGSLTKSGSGKLTLTGTNTYTGTTTISEGTLQLGDGGTTGSIPLISTITDNGTLAINRSNTATQGVDFGLISGTGGFIQAGSGTTIFNLANTYIGTTTVDAGTLVVNGTISGSTTTVNGGVLGGTGSVGSVMVGGGTIAPGDPNSSGGIGDFTANGNVSFGSTSAFNIQFDSSEFLKDLLNINGTLTISSGAVLNVTDIGTNPASLIGITGVIIDYANGGWTAGNLFSGTQDDQTFIASSGFTYLISYDGAGGVSEVTLTLVSVPEPGAAVSLLGGLGLLLGVRRRRK